MTLTDDARSKIETLAKEAARRHFQKQNPAAAEDEAWRFALRSWRSPEFVHAACDCLAIGRALDEAAAALKNSRASRVASSPTPPHQGTYGPASGADTILGKRRSR